MLQNRSGARDDNNLGISSERAGAMKFHQIGTDVVRCLNQQSVLLGEEIGLTKRMFGRSTCGHTGQVNSNDAGICV